MATATASKGTKKARGPRFVTLQAGPCLGVRDTLDSSTASPEYLSAARNVFRDPQYGSWEGRPGTKILGSSGSGQQLGSVGKRRMQGAGQISFYSNTGTVTRTTVVVAGGQFYTYNWSSDTFTEVLTAANLSAASVTLDSAARVYFLPFNNTLLVSDGVNTPWTWDGTLNGGITKLTNCPVLFGQPVNYYAKVVGIKALNRNRFVWSEENAANTGYETAPYNNYWDFTQTDANILVALLATNDVLYVYRQRSAAAVTGRVDTQFASSGVRSNVSNVVGTSSSSAVVFYEDRIVFLDTEAKVRMQVGNTTEDAFWRDSRQTLGGLSLGLLNLVMGVAYTPASLVLFGVPETGQSEMSTVLVFMIQGSELNFAGVWNGWGTFTWLGMVADQNGVPYLMRGDLNGYVYQHGNPDSGLYNDVTSGAVNNAIPHSLTPSFLGAGESVEYDFLRADFVFRAITSMTLSCSYTTPRATNTAQNFTVTAPGAVWDVSQWDVGVWAGVSVDLHKALGWNGNGRWIQPALTHQAIGEAFGWQSMTVDAKAIDRQPLTP